LKDRIVILNTLNLKGLPGGSYQILLQLHDQVSGQSLVRRAPFKIVPEPKTMDKAQGALGVR